MRAVYVITRTGWIVMEEVAAIIARTVMQNQRYVMGDKTYGTIAIRTYIISRDATYTIPPKTNTLEP